MFQRTIYCSACDREVQVANLPLAPREGAGREVPDAGAAVCLDCGRLCTGAMCPLFDVPPARMRAQLRALALRASPPEAPEKEAS